MNHKPDPSTALGRAIIAFGSMTALADAIVLPIVNLSQWRRRGGYIPHYFQHDILMKARERHLNLTAEDLIHEYVEPQKAVPLIDEREETEATLRREFGAFKREQRLKYEAAKKARQNRKTKNKNR